MPETSPKQAAAAAAATVTADDGWLRPVGTRNHGHNRNTSQVQKPQPSTAAAVSAQAPAPAPAPAPAVSAPVSVSSQFVDPAVVQRGRVELRIAEDNNNDHYYAGNNYDEYDGDGDGDEYYDDNAQSSSSGVRHVPCKFFRMGKCQNGDKCPFSHDLNNTSEIGECEYFLKGNCKFGTNCALKHVDAFGNIHPTAATAKQRSERRRGGRAKREREQLQRERERSRTRQPEIATPGRSALHALRALAGKSDSKGDDSINNGVNSTAATTSGLLSSLMASKEKPKDDVLNGFSPAQHPIGPAASNVLGKLLAKESAELDNQVTSPGSLPINASGAAAANHNNTSGLSSLMGTSLDLYNTLNQQQQPRSTTLASINESDAQPAITSPPPGIGPIGVRMIPGRSNPANMAGGSSGGASSYNLSESFTRSRVPIDAGMFPPSLEEMISRNEAERRLYGVANRTNANNNSVGFPSMVPPNSFAPQGQLSDAPWESAGSLLQRDTLGMRRALMDNKSSAATASHLIGGMSLPIHLQDDWNNNNSDMESILGSPSMRGPGGGGGAGSLLGSSIGASLSIADGSLHGQAGSSFSAMSRLGISSGAGGPTSAGFPHQRQASAGLGGMITSPSMEAALGQYTMQSPSRANFVGSLPSAGLGSPFMGRPLGIAGGGASGADTAGPIRMPHRPSISSQLALVDNSVLPATTASINGNASSMSTVPVTSSVLSTSSASARYPMMVGGFHPQPLVPSTSAHQQSYPYSGHFMPGLAPHQHVPFHHIHHPQYHQQQSHLHHITENDDNADTGVFSAEEVTPSANTVGTISDQMSNLSVNGNGINSRVSVTGFAPSQTINDKSSSTSPK